jgi:hypothetical protein
MHLALEHMVTYLVREMVRGEGKFRTNATPYLLNTYHSGDWPVGI